MDRIKNQTQAIIEIKRSVFTADVNLMTDESLIKPFIESQKARFPKSTHIAYAAKIAEGTIQKYSDDGEPQGTAGLPILEAITHYHLTDLIVTVRRDYGGVLLGASGLVRAYREAAHQALKKVQRLKKKTTLPVSFQLSYKEYELIKHRIDDWLMASQPAFGETVYLKGSIDQALFDAFIQWTHERLNRALTIDKGPLEVKYLADQ